MNLLPWPNRSWVCIFSGPQSLGQLKESTQTYLQGQLFPFASNRKKSRGLWHLILIQARWHCNLRESSESRIMSSMEWKTTIQQGYKDSSRSPNELAATWNSCFCSPIFYSFIMSCSYTVSFWVKECWNDFLYRSGNWGWGKWRAFSKDHAHKHESWLLKPICHDLQVPSNNPQDIWSLISSYLTTLRTAHVHGWDTYSVLFLNLYYYSWRPFSFIWPMDKASVFATLTVSLE